jgi:hypothetical protein
MAATSAEAELSGPAADLFLAEAGCTQSHSHPAAAPPGHADLPADGDRQSRLGSVGMEAPRRLTYPQWAPARREPHTPQLQLCHLHCYQGPSEQLSDVSVAVLPAAALAVPVVLSVSGAFAVPAAFAATGGVCLSATAVLAVLIDLGAVARPEGVQSLQDHSGCFVGSMY